MEYKDYYKTLGVSKDATEDEIRKAYRRLARQYHPDVNPGDKKAEARFKEVNEANEVLSDPDKRRKYDELGSSWQQWQTTGRDPRGFDWSQWTSGQPGGGVHVEYGDLGDLFGGGGGASDFFRTIFGGMGGAEAFAQQRSNMRGQDLEHPLEITLEEAYQGTKRVLQIGRKRIEVKIPAGVDNGSRVRVAGKGGPGGGGRQGDLYLTISVLPHATFRREGRDLYCAVPVNVYAAVLGGEVGVPTLKGNHVMLKIPAETQNGKRFRLKGLGMPDVKDKSTGDLYAEVNIILPQRLSDKEQQLFQELAALRAS